MDLLIRDATEADAFDLLQYLKRVGKETDHLLFGANGNGLSVAEEGKFLNRMATSRKSTLILGIVNGEIICVGSITASENDRIGHQGELAISVLQAYWGKGVASQLLEEHLGFAQKVGPEGLYLGVKEDNAIAIGLYEKFGFQQTGRRPKFVKIADNYFDVIQMWRSV